jgi:hypothetical protein
MSKRILTPFRKKYLNFQISEQRRKVKLQCVAYKGGKCQKCGYNKCPAAMIFHHPDPNQKDFGISSNGVSRSFEKCKPEIEKCILLCSNCHAETHHEETEKAREIKRQEIEEEKRKGNYKTKHSTLAQLVVAPSC